MASGRPVVDVATLGSLRELPASGAVAITFDDGHESNLNAAQALAANGLTGTFFVNPSTVGTRHFLSWQALADMAAIGMSIQSHSLHHRFLSDLTIEQVQQELIESRLAIEDRLGQPVTVLRPQGGALSTGCVV